MSFPSPLRQQDRRKFPGMRRRETAVMRLWLKDYEEAFDEFQYNVRIGVGRDPGPKYSDYVRKTAIMSSQLRMDAVAWNGTQATLIELKNYALPAAVQQLSRYGAVWSAENPSLPRPHLLLVCTGADGGVMPSAAAAGVIVHVVDASQT